jgi:hypothetical protein
VKELYPFLNCEVGMESFADIAGEIVRENINRKAALLMEPPLVWVEDTTPTHNKRSTPCSDYGSKEYYGEHGVRVR